MSALRLASEPPAGFAATRNACHVCTPLGACLVFHGIERAIPLLHGSQGCSTYIRRYLIGHFRDPVDIASSNFSEAAAVYGGGPILRRALENVIRQYAPGLIGIATTCLSETIGDDVSMYLHEFRRDNTDRDLPVLVHVSTPSYRGTHAEGFHAAVRAVAAGPGGGGASGTAGEYPAGDGLPRRPPLSQGDCWPTSSFRPSSCRITPTRSTAPHGTTISDCRKGERHCPPSAGWAGRPPRSSWGRLSTPDKTAGGPAPGAIRGAAASGWACRSAFASPMPCSTCSACARIAPFPLGTWPSAGGWSTPTSMSHKYLFGRRAVVYGEEDLVAGLAAFLSEIGVSPVLCASGGRSGRLAEAVAAARAWRPSSATVSISSSWRRQPPSCGPTCSSATARATPWAASWGCRWCASASPFMTASVQAVCCTWGTGAPTTLVDRIANTLIAAQQDGDPTGYMNM